MNTTIRGALRKFMTGIMGRDYNAVFKYPDFVDAEELYNTCQRGIGYRVATVFPKATWKEYPKLDGTQEFIDAFNELNNRVGLLSSLARLDVTAGFGHYAILVIGLNDGKRLDEPVTAERPLSVTYLQPYGEKSVNITRWETDPKSRRYGQPVLYQVTRKSSNPDNASTQSFNVHYSRVIHVAEDATDDPCYGVCRPELVIDNLIDLKKLLGGGAELYWLNAAAIYHVNAAADAEIDSDDKEALRGGIDDAMEGLTRYVMTKGIEVGNISPGLMGADPSNLIDKTLDFIAGTISAPKRILYGSEQGELASSQDENNWSSRVRERGNIHVIPNIIDKTIAYLIGVGALPGGYNRAYWNDLDSLGDEKRAAIASTKAQALQLYKNTVGADEIISPMEFRAWLGEKGSLPLDAIEEQLLAESDDDADNIEAIYDV